ncbi:hypothetical protein CRE_13661 [Caenorhabditis remanei]|uniref:Uncharacterized protein n=1 Tax=Caenorhabditis remanei TaxID=31234 RepID=E3N7J0_CAERE|nr:hypothetical protein CRE_13661 [Caenorhabditis remanei]
MVELPSGLNLLKTALGYATIGRVDTELIEGEAFHSSTSTSNSSFDFFNAHDLSSFGMTKQQDFDPFVARYANRLETFKKCPSRVVRTSSSSFF